MVSNRCKLLVKEELKKMGLHFVLVELGEVETMEELSTEEIEQLREALMASGLEIIDDKKMLLIERVKNAITEMIHNADGPLKHNYSDYLSLKLGYDYTYMSNLFSDMKGITIQQYIILHKIERVKELLMYEDMNLTEISYKMHYSSVAHLSNQFKKVTGLSPSSFMKHRDKKRQNLEELGSETERKEKKHERSSHT